VTVPRDKLAELREKFGDRLDKFLGLVVKLHRLLLSDNANESATARQKLKDLLASKKMTSNDLEDVLAVAKLVEAESSASEHPDVDPDLDQVAPNPDINLLELVRYLLEEYIALTPHEYTAVALWILHTHVFDKFMVTPRLALISPVRGCGKTTLLDVIATLAARSHKTDSITPAAIYHLIDSSHCTLLVDEADNLGFGANGTLRAIINSGHRKGGSRMHIVRGAPRRFELFAPMALATIGDSLPLPLMHRSVVVRMDRPDGARELRRFDGRDPALDVAWRELLLWARSCALDPDPRMPKALRNRAADNWRPLVSIADAFGWGDAARESAVAITARAAHDEDPAVILLRDIRALFDARGVDRLSSATIVEALNALEDGMWAEWRGILDDQQPRRLSQPELARLLAGFRIRPKTIWWPGRPEVVRSRKGYLRSQFEAAWRRYCSDDADAGTPSQRRTIRHLRSA
jgi:hypothetical protein